MAKEVFDQKGTFAAYYAAEKWCKDLIEVDELLGLRETPEEPVVCPYCGVAVAEGDTERPTDYCSHDMTFPHPRVSTKHQATNYAVQGAAAGQALGTITSENYPVFRKAFKQALKDQAETFVFKGQEVLTVYAKYVVDYFDLTKADKQEGEAMQIKTETKSTMVVDLAELVEIIRRGCGSDKFSQAGVEFRTDYDDNVVGATITVVETTTEEG